MQIKEIQNGIHVDGVKAGFIASFVVTPDAHDTDFRVLTIDQIIDECADMGRGRVTLTGDDPLTQKDAPELIATLLDLDYKINLETNGGVPLKPIEAKIVDLLQEDESLNNLTYSLTYQCPSSGKEELMVVENISFLVKGDALIFMIAEERDLAYALDIIEANGTQAEIFFTDAGLGIEAITQFVSEHNLQDVRVQAPLV